MKMIPLPTERFLERPRVSGAPNRVPRATQALRGEHAARFLVIYDGSLASNTALRAALEQATPDTEIMAVYCVAAPDLKTSAELVNESEMRATAYLAAAATNAYLRGREIQTKLLWCSAPGPGLVEHAQEWRADRIYLGVERERGESKMNSLAHYLRQFASREVVVVN
jgi:nucleotide-binding universal stress UspA family protein